MKWCGAKEKISRTTTHHLSPTRFTTFTPPHIWVAPPHVSLPDTPAVPSGVKVVKRVEVHIRQCFGERSGIGCIRCTMSEAVRVHHIFFLRCITKKMQSFGNKPMCIADATRDTSPFHFRKVASSPFYAHLLYLCTFTP